ncbi:hypothetical protein ICNINCKA_00090 [Synechococcus sp. CBW1107]|nr:transposase [Synechococcus sp. CBW1107]CAK6686882.1 hypothetical protein ICNINCKA_00090 [Synechococcus sp. CBW1107]
MAALGVQSGISKSQVSRICADIDVQVQAFLNRPLQESGYAYLYLDATYLHGQFGKAMQVCSRAVVVAMGINADGRRELLGIQTGDSETESFWSEFIAPCFRGTAPGSSRRPWANRVVWGVADMEGRWCLRRSTVVRPGFP